jgi:AcrR family transcriptional regulator
MPEASGTSAARRAEFVAAARELYESRGHARTTVKDIADKLGVTRSLFYHYFPDKDAITTEVLDNYVDDFIEALQYWNAQRQRGDVGKALKDILHIFRNAIFERDAFRRDLANSENAALYLSFTQRVADRIARYIVSTTVPEYARFHKVEIDHVYETFYVLIVGLIALMRAYPDISDEIIWTLSAQALHLDLGQLLPPGEQAKAAAPATVNIPRKETKHVSL